MAIQKATKTLKLIDACIKKDGGLEYRKQLKIAMDQADDPFSDKPEGHRSHLGGSSIGKECPRAQWYVFRWVHYVHHIPRMLRLFNRGHLEEPRFVALLRQAGMQVFQTDGEKKQFRVSGYGGHFGSAIDGVVTGCPDLPPGVPCLTEMKTHGVKSYTKLKKEGVRVAKYEHFVQMQIYMKFYKLPFALYLAVEKDTDDLWGEIIAFEPEVAEQYWQRAGFIVYSDKPPAKISPSTANFACKFCDFKDICHKGHQPERNCRTCRFAKPLEDGRWGCLQFKAFLDKERQLAGCEGWQLLEEISSASSTELSSIGS